MSVLERAIQSRGSSSEVVHRAVGHLLRATGKKYSRIIDVGCGSGGLARHLDGLHERYVGCDVNRYSGFPDAEWAQFVQADLDHPPYPIADECADAVLAVEVIEHLENPRAFVRELVRIARPGGSIVVTTPNQLSLLSKGTLLLKNQFMAFQEGPGLYPAHISALLEVDLLRIALECGLTSPSIHYTNRGRMPFSGRHWPFLGGRAFSDNIVLVAERPAR